MAIIRGVNKKVGLAREIMKLGHTFSSLSEELGCSRAIIGKWCNGDHTMNGKYVAKLNQMGIPIEAILNPIDYSDNN